MNYGLIMVDSILQVKQTDIADLNDNWDLVKSTENQTISIV